LLACGCTVGGFVGCLIEYIVWFLCWLVILLGWWVLLAGEFNFGLIVIVICGVLGGFVCLGVVC